MVTIDAFSNSKILANLLKRKGYSCVMAENGQEALDAVENTTDCFDIIFMDFTMPIMVRGFVSNDFIADMML